MINEVACNQNDITPESFGYVHMKEQHLVDVYFLAQQYRFSVLLWCKGTRGLLYNAFGR